MSTFAPLARCWCPRCEAKYTEQSAEHDELVALRTEVAALKESLAKLRNKAVFYLNRSKPFSDDAMADSSIRADLQRELFIIAADIGGGE